MSIAPRIAAAIIAVVLSFGFAASPAQAAAATSFAAAGNDAQATLLHVFYAGEGMWRTCDEPDCRDANSDWGTDSVTYTLYLRWALTHDADIGAVLAQLLGTATAYPSPCVTPDCPSWSDTPAWDAVALARESQVLGNAPKALDAAKAAFRYVQQSTSFVGGACPAIPYQQPQPSASRVKTLETDANETKAGLLIYQATGDRFYLEDAVSRYAADRAYFLDARTPLYTVHVIDDGVTCRRVPHRFFASVNGDMIWNGLALWRATGDRQYYDQAIATAKAVDTDLSDQRGVFTDLQGENDVEEPLVEAMYDLATKEHRQFAADWIVRNAAAALSARAADGSYARLFDGPAQSTTSVWESNGGLALEIAAGALDPTGMPLRTDAWAASRLFGPPITTLPAAITFRGSGIALTGTIAKLCQQAHVRVFIDGVQTFDQTGLWQNDAMPSGNSVFFAWRWARAGLHTIELEPGSPAEIGAPVVALQSYVLTSPSLLSSRIGKRGAQ
jgi:hypothetical protein